MLNRLGVISTGKHDGKICIEIQRGGGAIHAYRCEDMSIHSVVRLNQFLGRHEYSIARFYKESESRWTRILLLQRGA